MEYSDDTYRGTMLPVQPLLRNMYSQDEESLINVLYEMIVKLGNLKSPTEDFELQESNQVRTEEMACSPMLLRFLQILVLLKQPRRILEIGTFIGISTMYMAKALSKEGRIVTIEKYDHFARIAQENFTINGFTNKIELIEGDALEEIKKFNQRPTFDLIFLDGNKEKYNDYFYYLDRLLLP
jgi:caffeoyl-CoA O-methyltransferase/O-methyltransferase